jgi:Skp family chaperone for outer membrane proteins
VLGRTERVLSVPTTRILRVALAPMRRVAEYQAHANECRKIAARMARPEDKELLEQLAQAWEKVAKLRKRHITDGDDG